MGMITSLARMWLTRSIRPFYFSSEYDKFLDYQNTENLGLYVHIPFCRSLCSFCPYCKMLYDEMSASEYVEALLKEIKMVGEMNNGEKKRVSSLYFGGGTPALLSDYL